MNTSWEIAGGTLARSGEEILRNLDQMEVDAAIQRSLDSTKFLKTTLAPLPPLVDHSVHISYVRHQGAYACGHNAGAAAWDIVNTMRYWPHFHPNLSVNRMLWAWEWGLRGMKAPGFWGINYDTAEDYLCHFGCATEGSELTNSDATRWPTDTGNAECPNYRLDRHPQAVAPRYDCEVPVNVAGLRSCLVNGPVRVTIWGNHFVTLVGYDDNTSQFKFINSWGDRWGEGGFGYVDYSHLNQEIQSAGVFVVKPPRPIPCARFAFKAEYRQDVFVWLRLEGRPSSSLVWPSGQCQDDSRNLSLTVALPRGFAWPPSDANRVYLDIYHSGARSNLGGTMEEFTLGFCGQYMHCAAIAPDPVTGAASMSYSNALNGGQPSQSVPFSPGKLLRLQIP